MCKNARPPRSVSPKLAQPGERGHQEPPSPQTKFTKKQWKAKQEQENLRIKEKLEARRREGFLTTAKGSSRDTIAAI